MKYWLTAAGILAILISFPISRIVKTKIRRKSKPLSVLLSFVAALLRVAGLLLVLLGIRRERLCFVFHPLFLLGMVAISLGASLVSIVEPRPRKQVKGLISGQDLLFELIVLTVLGLLCIYLTLKKETYLIARVLLGAAGAVMLLAFALSIKHVKATWRPSRPMGWLPALSLFLMLSGLGLAFLSVVKSPASMKLGMSVLGVSPSGEVAVEAYVEWRMGPFDEDPGSLKASEALLVCDPDGHSIKELITEDRQTPYAEWSRDGRYLYLCRRESEGDDAGGLWRYAPDDGSLTFLRRMPFRGFRISPDNIRIAFGVRRDRESGGQHALVLGLTSSDSGDKVACEGGAVFWPPNFSWGPRSGKLYFLTAYKSSLEDRTGLWSVDFSDDDLGEPAFLLSRHFVDEIVCNAAETHLAILNHPEGPAKYRPRLEVIDLATHQGFRPRMDGPVLLSPWEDDLAWDRNGTKLAFADSRALKSYEIRTRKVRVLVQLRSKPGTIFDDRPNPVGWLPDGNVLFLRDFRARLCAYSTESGRAKTSPLNRRIRKWLIKHKTPEPVDE